MTDAMTTDTRRDDPVDGSSPLAEILGAGLAVAVIGGLLCLVPSQVGVTSRIVAPPAATIDAAGYEALRDALAADRSLAPSVRKAMADGRVDVVEMERIAPDAMRMPTTMTADAARADLLDTLKAEEGR
jgi:hypothetical protein